MESPILFLLDVIKSNDFSINYSNDNLSRLFIELAHSFLRKEPRQSNVDLWIQLYPNMDLNVKIINEWPILCLKLCEVDEFNNLNNESYLNIVNI